MKGVQGLYPVLPAKLTDNIDRLHMMTFEKMHHLNRTGMHVIEKLGLPLAEITRHVRNTHV